MLEEAIVEQSENIIYKGYLSTIEEVVEHVKAADTLGLGFRVESYTVSSPADAEDAQQSEFEFTLLGDLPVRQESED
jgi:hypothetical protein